MFEHTCPVCSCPWSHDHDPERCIYEELICPSCEFNERRDEDLVRDDLSLAQDQDTADWERQPYDQYRKKGL